MAPVPDSLPLRERRRRETRSEIHRAALDRVEKLGVGAATVEAISNRAGISVRTFFNYFPSKESAIILSLPPLPEPAAAAFLQGTDPARLFDDLAEVAVSHIAEHDGPASLEPTMRVITSIPALLELQFSEFARLEEELNALIGSRLRASRINLPADLISALFMAAVRTAVRRWSAEPAQSSLSDHIRSCAAALSPLVG